MKCKLKLMKKLSQKLEKDFNFATFWMFSKEVNGI